MGERDEERRRRRDRATVDESESALDEVKRLREQFAAVAACVPGVISSFRLTPDGRMSLPFATDGLEDLCGVSPADVREDFSPLASVIHPDDRGEVLDRILASSRTMAPWSQTFRIEHPHKGQRWLDGHALPKSDPDGGVSWHGFVHDVTIRVEAELREREREDIFAKIANQSLDAVALIDADSLAFLEFNDAAHQDLGYSREEFARLRVPDIQFKPSEDRVKNNISRIRAGRGYVFETQHKRKDGRLRDVRVSGRPMQIGGRDRIAVVWTDLSERKQAERELRRSEVRLREAQRLARFGDWECVRERPDEPLSGKNFRLTCSDEIERILGRAPPRSLEELVAALDVVHPDDQELVQHRIAALIDGKVLPELVFRARLPDGQQRHILAMSRVETDGDEIIRLNGTLQDVTQLRSVENALRETQARMRVATETTGVGTWEWDAAENTFRWDRAMFRIYGIEPSADGSIAYSAWAAAVVPEDLPEQEQATLGRTLKGGGAISRNFRIRRASDGALRYIQTLEAVRTDHNGKARWVIGTNLDVTEQRLFEIDLLVKEAAISTAAAGIALAGLDGKLEYVNKAWLQMFGFDDPSEVIGLRVVDFAADPEHLAAAELIVKESGRWHGEVMRKRRDGTVFPAEVRVNTVTSPAGEPLSVLAAFVDITDRKRAERALQDSEAQFRSLVEAAPEAVFVLAGETFRYANQTMVKLVGASRVEDLVDHPWADRVAPAARAALADRIHAATNAETEPLVEQEFLRLDGTSVVVEMTSAPYRFGDDDGLLVFARDTTARRAAEEERRRLEAQLQQAQRLESVGRLAGGVAHDFNNLLTGIMMNADACRDELPEAHETQPLLEEIISIAERSAGITRQLLAFASKQTISPIVLDLNAHVTAMVRLLRRLIGENIELLWRPTTKATRVEVDPAQLDQVIANFAVNARDAIDGVGTVTVSTDQIEISATDCEDRDGLSPGPFVVLEVSDSGVGMDDATRTRVFEPFFTTKAPTKGSGLGLSTVYGIVKQSQGFVEVTSEPGRGTTFRVYLPCVKSAADDERARAPADRAQGGSETILLVEDERSVREASVSYLRRMGYSVLAASTPKEALHLLEQHAAPIHLLVTDMVLPRMSGKDLATILTERFPEMPVLFMSGYTHDPIAHRAVLKEGVNFLPKPFTREDLGRRVRALLGSSDVS